MPGDNIDMNVELITPIAIENGLRFAIREGGRTVGSGVVIAINEDVYKRQHQISTRSSIAIAARKNVV